MTSIPEPVSRAAAAFDSLPGLGPRAALRYAFWLITQPKDAILRFAKSVEGLATNVTTCTTCHAWADRSPCAICRDPSRDRSSLCVVATSQDLRAVEETGAFHGTYHVLNGTLDPIEGRTAEKLTIVDLMARLRDGESPIKEVILALDTDIPGDTTTLYLRKQMTGLPVKITRLARGLPTGAALEYADANTIADAIENRKETNGN